MILKTKTNFNVDKHDLLEDDFFDKLRIENIKNLSTKLKCCLNSSVSGLDYSAKPNDYSYNSEIIVLSKNELNELKNRIDKIKLIYGDIYGLNNKLDEIISIIERDDI